MLFQKCFFFTILNIPNKVLGNSNSIDNRNKIDSSPFVQKPYLRPSYLEANIEKDIDLKNQ